MTMTDRPVFRLHKNRALFVIWMAVRQAGVDLAKCKSNTDVDRLVADMEHRLISSGADTGNRGSSVLQMRNEIRRALEWVMN